MALDDGHAFLLFSGTNDRAVYAIARVIRALGERLAIVARSATDKVLLGAYRDQVVWVRDSEELSAARFGEQVEHAKVRTGAKSFTVIPISEYFNTFLLDHRREVEAIAQRRIPLVARALYARVTNKASATAMFAQAGVRIPREILLAEAVIPYVAKPKANIVDGISLYPLLVETDAQDRTFRRDPRAADYFLQEFVTGRSIYLLFYIASNGERFVSSQENFAQQPEGKSILLAATSDFHHSATARLVLDTLQRAGFTGLGMVEFIVDGSGACFIELNPRLWGPLGLCADHRCGIIEAFVGDCARGDPGAYVTAAQRLPLAAKYLWLGGAIHSLRHHGRFDHRMLSTPQVVMQVLGALTSDVYLRRDSWRVFLREVAE